MRAAKSASSRQPASSRKIWTRAAAIVVFHSEEAEAEGEEEGIAGKADEGGNQLLRCDREGIATVEQDVFGQVAVDERIAIDLEEIFQHPKAQDEAGCERGADGAARA